MPPFLQLVKLFYREKSLRFFAIFGPKKLTGPAHLYWGPFPGPEVRP